MWVKNYKKLLKGFYLFLSMDKFNEKEYIQVFCDRIKKEINGKVLISVSGGVDSTTSAALLKKAGVEHEVLLMDSLVQKLI